MMRVNVLGSTGSIGTHTLRVIARHPDRFTVNLLLAGNNLALLKEQIRQFRPAYAAMHDPKGADDLRRWLGQGESGTRFISYEEALAVPADVAVAGIVGIAGLLPAWHALDHCSRLALANKESMVVAGEWIREKAADRGVTIIPVDSEHSAIHQCLRSGSPEEVDTLVLTASGGPFFGMDGKALSRVRVSDALNHPTWRMGDKVTIDSATLMNKGLEVIEAHYLFDIPYDRIRVKIHPASQVHSMVAFRDGSVLAQLGVTDMEVPIQYALTWPDRLSAESFRFPLDGDLTLAFHDPDPDTFRCLELAYQAGRGSHRDRVVLNSSNEVAVRAFLEGKLSFTGIPALVGHMMETMTGPEPDGIEDILALDHKIQQLASQEVVRGHF